MQLIKKTFARLGLNVTYEERFAFFQNFRFFSLSFFFFFLFCHVMVLNACEVIVVVIAFGLGNVLKGSSVMCPHYQLHI